MKEHLPGKAVMVRPDTASLSLITLVKEEGGGAWLRCPGGHPIPRDIMLPSYKLPNKVDVPAVEVPELGDKDDAMLVAASIGAESQS
jgi:hypothetical protein